LEAAWAVLKIGLSLKPNHHKEVKLAQIRETLCTYMSLYLSFGNMALPRRWLRPEQVFSPWGIRPDRNPLRLESLLRRQNLLLAVVVVVVVAAAVVGAKRLQILSRTSSSSWSGCRDPPRETPGRQK